jgi:IclR family transcriptional regulator, acetate operon repressor
MGASASYDSEVCGRCLTERARKTGTMRTSEVEARGARYEIAVVGQALDLVMRLAEVGEISTGDAGRALGISRSTAYRLLVTLQTRRFVEHNQVSRRWSLGTPFVNLITSVSRTRLRTAALPSMRLLLKEEQETVNLAEFVDGELVYVHILESPQAFRMSNVPGEAIPLHATALGKAVLAAHRREHWPELVAGLDLRAITPNTVITPKELLSDLDVTQRRGWGEDRGETVLGVVCFGAPIIGTNGAVLGGISVSLPEARLDAEREKRLGNRLLESATRITAEIASTTTRPGMEA